MNTLYESILKSTNSGVWSKPLDYTTKTYVSCVSNIDKICEDFCKFYKIKDSESTNDVKDAIDRAVDIFEGKIEVVLDKTVYKRLLHALERKDIVIEHDLDYLPVVFKTDDVPLVVKTDFTYGGVNKKFYWIWHWGSKKDLFTWQNSWLMIYPK